MVIYVKSMYDVRQLLKKFGVFIYTGTKIGDVELMEMEIRELYDLRIISVREFQHAMLIIQNEKSHIKKIGFNER